MTSLPFSTSTEVLALTLEEWNPIGLLGQTNEQQFLEKMVFQGPITFQPVAHCVCPVYILALNNCSRGVLALDLASRSSH